MRIAKTLRFNVRNREYENIQVEVTAEADQNDAESWDDCEMLVTEEVEHLAVQELRRVAAICVDPDNAASDYLHAINGSQRANNQKTQPTATTGRRLRRGGQG